MRAFHNTRDANFRNPYGAVRLGGAVSLALDVFDEGDVSCSCRVWVDDDGETIIPMKGVEVDGHLRFSCELTPKKAEILWYSFEIKRVDGNVSYYGAQNGRRGGEGFLSDEQTGSFQITVYRQRETVPEWYKNGIVYQIFPDRYRRGPGWEENSARALSKRRNGPDRVLRQDWYATPAYLRDGEGRVLAWDFYGGTLSGIKEELPHLREMGITALYLNPIFEAASNHRYDTADYLNIDPMLGDEKDFKELCADAKEQGISIILDGVFNHTGCDSRYFNKYDNYPEVGAYQSPDSPYRSWYQIDEDGKTYCSWWGVADLPDVVESNPSYRKFIFGRPNGVVRHWLKAGARGWRLDVADEMPDDFIAGIKKAVLETKPDGLLLGEVWEDASNKISYGKFRSYLLGDELDSAMNYPLRDALLPFFLGDNPAWSVAEQLESLHENYPPDAFYECLNLLGSHDRARLLTVLGGAPDPNSLSEDARRDYRLNPGLKGLAKGRLWLATLLQMTMPGVPCIYYGDEAGLEGYADPFNRAGYPWGREDVDCQNIYRNCIAIRRGFPFLVDGNFEPFSCGDDVFGFVRMDKGGHEGMSVVVNRSIYESHEAVVPMRGERATEIVSGAYLRREGDDLKLTLSPLGSAVIYYHDEKRLAKKMERGSGVLCHITSLPNEDRQGTLGAPAKRFVDDLEKMHQKYWQVLPVNPTDAFGSPYAGLSAFAGNVRLLDDDEATLRVRFVGNGGIADGKGHGIRDRIARLLADDDFRTFADENSSWLRPYATFMAIRDHLGPGVWQSWPEEYRSYTPDLAQRRELKENVAYHEWCQFEFQHQWDDLHVYANEHGVKIIGDMPIYVSADSSSVWSRPEFFKLNVDGNPEEIAGTPPDQFAADGQLWGNPTYDWDVMRADGYAWWVERLRRAFRLYDYVRIDHFLGFEQYYSVPKGKTARDGRWLPGPGASLFKKVHEELGDLPIIAEDLGSITPAVRGMVATVGCPGMDVLQFNDGDVRQGYVPAPGKIAYTSTHDTNTLLGWCEERFGDQDDVALAKDLIHKVMDSSADVAIFPLQDVLGLGGDARMNVPGVADGNWSWQARQADIDASVERFLGCTERGERG